MITESIRRAVDIVGVIQQVVPLKKSGSNFFGRCPFHNEKSPSFSVSPSKQLFHCFGCKAGGDVFKFVQLYHGWDFNQALEELAKVAGITLERQKSTTHWDEGFKILQVAQDFFREVFESSHGESFRHYLAARHIPSELWESFQIGAHPGGDFRVLVKYLTDRGVDLDFAVQLGLLGRSDRGDYIDRFVGRLMFPIIDERAKIRGFGGRTLKNEQPKYINSPKSPFFDKSRLFYGMHLACREVARKGYVVLVEGYFDVIALYQFGITNVLGSMGTALTVDQIRLMKRWAQKAVSLYDSDKAGLLATERNLGLFMKEGLESKVVTIPSGKDPDGYLHDTAGSDSDKKKGLRNLFEQAQPALEYLVEKTVLSEATATARGRKLRGLVELLDQIPDELQRMVVKKDLARKFDLPEKLLGSTEGNGREPLPPTVQAQQKLDGAEDRWEREMVRFLCSQGARFTVDLGDLRLYCHPQSKWTSLLVRFLDLGLDSKGIASLDWLNEETAEIQTQIREWCMTDSAPVEDGMGVWSDLMKGLKRAYFKREGERLQKSLTEAEASHDTERVRQLLIEKRDLAKISLVVEKGQ